MSNFLARMLDRTLISSDAVRPVARPIFANEATSDHSHSVTLSSDEGNTGLPKEGDPMEYSRTDMFAADSDAPSVIPVGDERAAPDRSTRSKSIGDSRIVSGRDGFPESEAGGEHRLPSGTKAAGALSGQPIKAADHHLSDQEEGRRRVFSGHAASEMSEPPEKGNTSRLKSSPRERPSASIQRKAATDNSLSSLIHAGGEAPKEAGVSDVGGLSKKHGASKSSSYDVKPRSEKYLEWSSQGKDVDEEDLLIPSGFDRHSHRKTSSGPEQKGYFTEKGTSLDKGSSSAAPVVKVTIGRIEVRAVTQQPPSPQRRTAPAQPRLSLADYLKRRDGGFR